MKANLAARYLVRIRVTLVGAALVALVGVELYVGQSLTTRLGQTAGQAAPTVCISDLIISVH